MRVRTPGDFGNLVRERRREMQMSQQQLADLVGVSRSWLVAVESGHARAELGLVLALLSELDLGLDISLDPAAARRRNPGRDAHVTPGIVTATTQTSTPQVEAPEVAQGRGDEDAEVDLDELLARHDRRAR